MTTEILRRAASLMRERATAATPGPWEAGLDGVVWRPSVNPIPGTAVVYDPELTLADSRHIAGMHPDPCLALARLLDTIERDVGTSSLVYHAAADCARAYLGEEPS